MIYLYINQNISTCTVVVVQKCYTEEVQDEDYNKIKRLTVL